MRKELPPLTDEFIRNGIASGWITPPSNGAGPSARRQAIDLVFYVVGFFALLALGFYYGLSVR